MNGHVGMENSFNDSFFNFEMFDECYFGYLYSLISVIG